MSDKNVSQEGIVVGTSGTKVLVRIISKSACASCHARGACSAADMADKIIETDAVDSMKFGDRVTVEMEEQMGWIAVLLAFFIPFLLVVVLLFTVAAWSGSEMYGAAAALLSLPVYYFLLYLSKRRLAGIFRFKSYNRDKRGEL